MEEQVFFDELRPRLHPLSVRVIVKDLREIAARKEGDRISEGADDCPVLEP
jgi:hypothetical protein